MIVESALQILALCLFAATFIPLIRIDHWTVRGWDFPRIQVFTAAAILCPVLFALGSRDDLQPFELFALAALVVSLATLAFWMLPYTKLHSRQVLDATGGPAIRFLISNVLMSNRGSEKLLALIREKNPDIIVALETDSWWTDRIASIAEEYPYAVEVPQEDTYGLVIRSRIELLDVSVEYLVRKNIPSVHTGCSLGDGTFVHLHVVHPKPPFPDEDESSTDRDAELLLVGRRAREHGGPTIVLGDLNDVAWSRTTRLFQKISGLLDPRIGRGFFSTFHAGHRFMRWPLDHVFISEHFRVRMLERLPNVGSDHFPMFAEFTFEPEGMHQQKAPEKDRGDDREAAEKIEAAD